MPLNERTINSAKNPKWFNAAHTLIHLEVDFDELDEEYVEFIADPNDIVSWGTDLYNRAVAGEFGEVAEFETPPDVTGIGAQNQLRAIRNELLEKEVDPLVSNPLRWNALTEEKQQEWADYRQALLDLPASQPSAYVTFNTSTESYEWVGLTLPTKPE